MSMNGESVPEASQRKAVHEEHYCMHEGCKKWGSFGFDMRFGIEWYCGEHRPTDYRGRD